MQICTPSTSWIGVLNSAPKNPLDLIEYAELVGTWGTQVGSFLYSPNFNLAAGWVPGSTPVTANPYCTAWRIDDYGMRADSAQWNLQHQTWDSSAGLALPVRRTIFLRPGREWRMSLPLDFGTDQYSDFQIGFLDEAADRGDCQGTWPVVQFNSGPYTGVGVLTVTLKPTSGNVFLGIRAHRTYPGPATFAMWEEEVDLSVH